MNDEQQAILAWMREVAKLLPQVDCRQNVLDVDLKTLERLEAAYRAACLAASEQGEDRHE